MVGDVKNGGGRGSFETRLLSEGDVKRIDAAAAMLDPDGGLAALMDRAGGAVADLAERRFGAREGAAVVLVGPGMNGGDGAVAALRLRQKWREVTLALLAEPSPGGIAADALNAYRAAGGAVVPAADGKAVGDALDGAAYIIDALFGVGLSRPLTDGAAALVGAANASSQEPGGPPILSVDLPSGVAANTGRALGPAIRADTTISFIGRKRGHRLADGALLSGQVETADIGAPPAALTGFAEEVFENDPELIGGTLAKPTASHKYDHGHALIASGGFGTTGAARLAARGALRIGAGLVTVAAPKAAMIECACHLTAIMLRSAETAEDFAAQLEDPRLNAVLIGPGHASHRGGMARSRDFVLAALGTQADVNGARGIVLDADALSAWPDPSPLFSALKGGEAVLTPHGGEFSRLFPDLAARLKDVAEAARFGKVEACREAAERSGAVVLFKGFDTVIAAPDGRVCVQCAVAEKAAPWLATAGSGDVLAGLITGLLARGFPPFEAACGGALAHLEAGRAAGPFAIAEDLPEHLQLF